MPHRVQAEQWTRGGNTFRDRPDYAVRLAEVVSSWADLEWYLALFLSQVSGALARGNSPGEWVPRDPLPMVVMDTIDSIQTRLSIVDRAVVSRISPARAEQWGAIREGIKKAAKHRNVVAHSRWGVSDEHPGALLRELDDKEGGMRTLELWRLADFEAIVGDIAATARALLNLIEKIQADVAMHVAAAAAAPAAPAPDAAGPG